MCMYVCAETEAASGIQVSAVSTVPVNLPVSGPRETSTDIQNMPVDEVSDAADGGRSSAAQLFTNRPSPSSAAVSRGQPTVDNTSGDASIQLLQPSDALHQGIFYLAFFHSVTSCIMS